MAGASDMEYKSMLLELSKAITNDELDQMKFMCKDLIKKRDRETVKRPIDLWEHLETREKIGPANLIFLKNLVGQCCGDRLDVLRIIEGFEATGSVYQNGTGPVINGPVPMQQQGQGLPPFQPMYVPVMQPAQQPYAVPAHNYNQRSKILVMFHV